MLDLDPRFSRQAHDIVRGGPCRSLRRICWPFLLVGPAGLALAGARPLAAQVSLSQPPVTQVGVPQTGSGQAQMPSPGGREEAAPAPGSGAGGHISRPGSAAVPSLLAAPATERIHEWLAAPRPTRCSRTESARRVA